MLNPIIRIYGFAGLLGAVVVLPACGGGSGDGDDGGTDVDLASLSSWEVIQTEIFNKQCTTCHRDGGVAEAQSKLALTADVAYEQLLDVAPQNSAARTDGFVRVSSATGDAAVDDSFLLWKIDTREHDHASHPHKAEYGGMMPPTGGLTAGQIEFVEQWIEAGAPKTGKVVDISVLEDDSAAEEEGLTPLAEPVSGKQFHLQNITVPPGSEREIFSYQALGNVAPVYVNRIQVNMAPGSHHFVIYTYPEGFTKALMDEQLKLAGLEQIAPFIAFPPKPDEYRDLHNGKLEIDPKTGSYRPTYDNRMLALMQFQQFIGATQWPSMDYQFPEGIALRLPANTWLELNSHYVNYPPEGEKGSVRQGEVYTNFHYADQSEVKHVAQMLELNNREIYLPPSTTPTTLVKDFIFDDSYDFDKELTVIQMFSHAHQRMQRFVVKVIGGAKQGNVTLANGAVVYEEDDWQHPDIKYFDDANAANASKRPLVFGKGQGLRLETTYLNDTDKPIVLGALSENEMMILFGYYYTDKKL